MEDSAATREFSLEFLKRITDDFSEKHIIGTGAYGVVYKGILENGEEIALKKLHYMPGLDDTHFKNEFNNLMRAQHPNITRLVGYCYDIRPQHIMHQGEYVFVHVEERVLCFEYLHGGSLDKHISDESCGLDWQTCFKIIKGVCEGLNYLHNGCEDPIYHLDLKPANILLDKNMVPKIGNFSLSMLFPSALGETFDTDKIVGTRGYMPPEYIERCIITSKHDVFSLGVIIVRIMAGHEGYYKCVNMSSQEFLEHVHENWGKHFHSAMSIHTSNQVKTCIEIALRCVEFDREKRPTIAEIIEELKKVDTAESSLTGQVERQKRPTIAEIIERLKMLDTTESSLTGQVDAAESLLTGQVAKNQNWNSGTTACYSRQMDGESSTRHNFDMLEHVMLDGNAKPTYISLSLLEGITNCFSDDNRIGSGGFAVVYKGKVGKGVVAVKKLSKTSDLPETKFHREIECLTKARHKNIVRFLGYCSEVQGRIADHEGKFIMSDIRHWLLCFEYVPNGSLNKYITDASCGLEWRKRYEIIKGICDGLLHLHEKRILHLDLKPGNILVDEHMVPKITDFGLSMCLDEDHSQAFTSNLCGSMGYFPPELLRVQRGSKGQRGFASDIYSLGVIIGEILMGEKWYPEYWNIEQVVENWMSRLEGSDQRDTQLEQVRVCTKIAIECMELDPKKRPVARDIIDMLDETESTIKTTITSS